MRSEIFSSPSIRLLHKMPKAGEANGRRLGADSQSRGRRFAFRTKFWSCLFLHPSCELWRHLGICASQEQQTLHLLNQAEKSQKSPKPDNVTLLQRAEWTPFSLGIYLYNHMTGVSQQDQSHKRGNLSHKKRNSSHLLEAGHWTQDEARTQYQGSESRTEQEW